MTILTLIPRFLDKERAAVLRTSRLNDFIADADATPLWLRPEPAPNSKQRQNIENSITNLDLNFETNQFTTSRRLGRPAVCKSDEGTKVTPRSHSTIWASSTGQEATARVDATKQASYWQQNTTIRSGTRRTTSSSFRRESSDSKSKTETQDPKSLREERMMLYNDSFLAK